MSAAREAREAWEALEAWETAHNEAALVAEGAAEDPGAEGGDTTLEEALVLQLEVVRVGDLLERRPIGEVVPQPPPLAPAVHAE